MEKSYVEHVDRSLELFAPAQRFGTDDFGDIATRRKEVLSIVDIDRFTTAWAGLD